MNLSDVSKYIHDNNINIEVVAGSIVFKGGFIATICIEAIPIWQSGEFIIDGHWQQDEEIIAIKLLGEAGTIVHERFLEKLDYQMVRATEYRDASVRDRDTALKNYRI